MGIYRLVILFVVFCMSIVHTLQFKDILVPKILLNIYDADLVNRCDLADVFSFAPAAVYQTKDGTGKLFHFDMTPPGHISSGLLVIHTDNPNPKTKLEVTINGKSELLQMRRLNESLVAPIDVVKNKLRLDLLIKKKDLIDFSHVDEFLQIYILTNIKEDCPHWKSFAANSVHARHTRSVNDLPKEEGVKKSDKGCTVKPKEVDFEELGLAANIQVLYPKVINMGTCSGECRSDQCSARQVNHADKASSLDSQCSKISTSGCVPTELKPLAIVTANSTTGMIELHQLEDFVISECGCL